MSTASLIDADIQRSRRRSLLVLAIAMLLPALGYFIFAVAGLSSGDLQIMRRIMNGLFVLSGAWSIPLLLLIAIGGPVLSAITSLILRMGRRSRDRMTGLCAGLAVSLILFNTWFVIFLLPFAFDD